MMMNCAQVAPGPCRSLCELMTGGCVTVKGTITILQANTFISLQDIKVAVLCVPTWLEVIAAKKKTPKNHLLLHDIGLGCSVVVY